MSAGNGNGGPLAGLKIVELAGIGPAPLCCSLMSDLGADVLRIDRNLDAKLGVPRDRRTDLVRRGRKSVSIDLKNIKGVQTAMRLIEGADVLVDPFRPGVTEKLGLGPDECFASNRKLIYARMTGWGQTGPLAHAAGHDLNYLSLTGIVHAIGPKEIPTPPLNVVADMGGGAMSMALGILAGVYETRNSGEGQVVDISMTEGSAYLALAMYGMAAVGDYSHERQDNILDGGAPFYRCYETKDGKFVSIASIEAKFYDLLLEKTGIKGQETLPGQFDKTQWPEMHARFEAVFKTKTREEWCEIMEGSDVCFAPVLTFNEAPDHPHNKVRGTFVDVEGVLQPNPAPRFSRTPGSVKGVAPDYGQNTRDGLLEWGFGAAEIDELMKENVVGWQEKD
ncbi:MAG: Succinyl-CoA--L-malate CoA-transferase beta subunit [Alphaproteobacteria bacterium MarineAlpha9_Bin6]|nr:MAG: Succinyl-CoA--L-malate CoA-transferase beta subunit [Alphaproteobacteria bacterium MarineAlpha9_Bin6]HIB56039.1 CoA transferase [Alphaproteobacteria bacterium]HIO01294.1 CoA transferase [Alphaproteobacteria bacterium]